ncbi:hypothetical protein ACQPW3_41985 [Actinosynnema sp. CA-248983]
MKKLFKGSGARIALAVAAVLGVAAVSGTAGVGIQPVASSKAAKAAKIVKSEIFYETYIPRHPTVAPQGYIDTPDVGCHNYGKDGRTKADWWNGVDNRTGPAFGTGQFRTQVVLTFDFKKKKYGERHTIHPTSRYKKVGGEFVYEDSRTAGDEGIRVEGEPKISAKTGRMVVSHKVTNPWCSGFAAIDWTMVIGVHRDGRTEVVGSHDKMPNHELWRQDTYSNGKKTQKLIFSHALVSPKCLIDYVGEALCKGLKKYSYKK